MQLPDQSDLAELESQVSHALETQDQSSLSVLGFGEISIAFGFPTEDPQFVCKRTPPQTAAQFDRYAELVETYIFDLGAIGLNVAPTKTVSIARKNDVIGYLVQPLYEATTLGHNVLGKADPDAEHPLLLALGDTIKRTATNRLSIDAQVTNWSWEDDRLTLLDVGTPFVWDSQGHFLFEMAPMSKMIPAPFRSLIMRDMTKVVRRWQNPRGVAVDVVANLIREKLDDWVTPAISAFNTTLDLAEPILESEAQGFFEEDLKTYPKLKKLQQLQRAWQTTVRRRPYDFFVQPSTFDHPAW